MASSCARLMPVSARNSATKQEAAIVVEGKQFIAVFREFFRRLWIPPNKCEMLFVRADTCIAAVHIVI